MIARLSGREPEPWRSRSGYLGMQTITGSRRYSSTHWPPGLGPGFCLFGALMIAWSIWAIAREISFESGTRRLDGQVVGFVQRSNRHGGFADVPVFRIKTNDARMVDAQSTFASRPRGWNLGDRAQVFYDPTKSAEVVPDTPFDRFGVSAMFSLAGAVFFVVGIFGAMTRRRSSQPRDE